jgi:hypothetical protein
MKFVISREIDTEFDNPYYSFDTIKQWQDVWKKLCSLAYNNLDRETDKITVFSSVSEAEDDAFYERNSTRIRNHHLLCFDQIWRSYDSMTPTVNTTLRYIYVPRVLFDVLGINSFMKEVFPNCEVVFWK